MKKLILIAGCAAFLWIIITGMTDVSDSKKTDVPQQSYVEESTDNVYYQLKEYDKRVAAFSSESKLPIYVSSVYVSELPKEDRLLLKAGITAESKKKLERLIEDYCS